jgi:hypothetical protein
MSMYLSKIFLVFLLGTLSSASSATSTLECTLLVKLGEGKEDLVKKAVVFSKEDRTVHLSLKGDRSGQVFQVYLRAVAGESEYGRPSHYFSIELMEPYAMSGRLMDSNLDGGKSNLVLVVPARVGSSSPSKMSEVSCDLDWDPR